MKVHTNISQESQDGPIPGHEVRKQSLTLLSFPPNCSNSDVTFAYICKETRFDILSKILHFSEQYHLT